MIPAWAAEYVGLEWDEATLNCWLFCRRVLRERFGIDVPSYDGEYEGPGDRAHVPALFADGEADWKPVDEAEARLGDLVLFRIHGLPMHVGLVLDHPEFLHVERNINSNIDRWDRPMWAKRVLGFYRHPELAA